MLQSDTEIASSVVLNLSELNQWAKRYIKDEAVFDLSMEVERGEVYCWAWTEGDGNLDSIVGFFEVLAAEEGLWIRLYAPLH